LTFVNLVKHFKQNNSHGNGLIIKGGVRRGKTTIASYLTRVLLKENFAVISNLRFHDSVYADFPNLHYITSDLEYFEAYLKVPEGMPIILVFDDSQASEGFKSTQVMTEAGDSLSKFLIFLGKFESNYIFIVHQKYIPSSIIDGFEPLFLYKLSRETMYLNTKFMLDTSEIVRSSIFVPVPGLDLLKPLPILSRAIAQFNWILDLKELYTYLAQYRIGEGLRQGVREYLAQQSPDTDKRLKRLKEISYKDIYLALCIKKGRLIKSGELLRDLINPNIVNEARKEGRGLGLQ
jgi:hypothetical protein